MINGRAKGHAFERELIKMFQDEFGDCANHLKRNLDQYQMVFPLWIMRDYSMKLAETITVDWQTGILLMRESLEFANETV